jgi:hypothetical protein
VRRRLRSGVQINSAIAIGALPPYPRDFPLWANSRHARRESCYHCPSHPRGRLSPFLSRTSASSGGPAGTTRIRPGSPPFRVAKTGWHAPTCRGVVCPAACSDAVRRFLLCPYGHTTNELPLERATRQRAGTVAESEPSRESDTTLSRTQGKETACPPG